MSKVIRSEQQIYTEGYRILMFFNWNHYCLFNPFVEGIGPSQICYCVLLTGNVPYQYYVHSLGLFTGLFELVLCTKGTLPIWNCSPWMRDMTGHWTVLYYISYWMCIEQLYMLKRLSPAIFHTHVSGWESTPCSLTCQFSRGPWKQHSRARPIRAPIGLRLRATPMGGLLTVSKNARVP